MGCVLGAAWWMATGGKEMGAGSGQGNAGHLRRRVWQRMDGVTGRGAWTLGACGWQWASLPSSIIGTMEGKSAYFQKYVVSNRLSLLNLY